MFVHPDLLAVPCPYGVTGRPYLAWPRDCSAVPPEPTRGVPSRDARRTSAMSKLMAILVLVASFLLVAPVLESGTPNHVTVFQAVGDACDGGGGGGW